MAEREPIDQIVKALIAVRSGCATIPKTGFNSFHKYKYVTEADVSAHIEPLMTKHGLVLIPSVAPCGDGFTDNFPAPFIDDHGVTQMVLKYTLAHESGQVWPEPLYTVAHGDDHNSKSHHGDKGAYKASTGGFKYTLLRLLMVATGDDPELTAKPEPKEKAPKAASAKRLAELTKELQEQALALLDIAALKEINKAPQDEAAMVAAIRGVVLGFMGVSGRPTENQIDPLLAAIKATELAPNGEVSVPGSPEEF